MSTNRSERNYRKTKGRSKSARLRVRGFLDLFAHNDTVLVLINPDPDSMASAFAVRRLLWRNVRKAIIAYIGEIQRLENLAMMELLKIPMVRIRDLASDDFTRHVLVDSQPHHFEILGNYAYDAIIDHHPKGGNWEVSYVDIRPEYGATATMLVEYLRAARIKPSKNLATALLYAIKTDTCNFERDSTEEDVKQFWHLFRYANLNLLRKIERSEFRSSDLDYFQKALTDRVDTKRRVYAHLGRVEGPDICVQVADFFMRVYGIGWSFASCVYKDSLIVIFRSDGYRKDAGSLAIRAFGSYGSAGGHRGAARAEIPLDTLRQKGIKAYDASLKRFVRQRLKI